MTDSETGQETTTTTTTLYLPDGTELSHDQDTGEVSGRRYYTFAGRTVAVREGNHRSEVSTLMADPQGSALYAVANETGTLTVRRQAPYGGPRPGDPNHPDGLAGADTTDTDAGAWARVCTRADSARPRGRRTESRSTSVTR